MTVSVIIPTLNAASSITPLLERLRTQEVRPDEVIVIDSSSDDDTAEIAKDHGSRVLVIPRNSFNHGGTRNRAAVEAKGDILLFMTQDALPFNNHLIGNLISPLSEPDIVASYARHVPRNDASPLVVFSCLFNYPLTSYVKGIDDLGRYGIKTFFCSNVCSAFKKDIFMKVGMFPEGIPSNEDMLIAARLITGGYRIAYVPDAVVIHSHRYSLTQLFRRYYNIGVSLKRNRWVLRYSGGAGREGLRFLSGQIGFVIKNYGLKWLPQVFLEALVKLAGYRIGLIRG
ncbi:MAG: glycosyltransferase family 2 protein [Thermodesulfovibrionales bacterium]